MDDQFLPYLPEALRGDPATQDLLKAFEVIMLGRSDSPGTPGLEQLLDGLPRYFTPAQGGVPDDFLPWLSQWVALSLRTDIYTDAARNNALRRQLITDIAQRYRWRGTKQSLAQLLKTFTGWPAKIDDQFDQEPHFFQVRICLEDVKTSHDKAEYDRVLELAHSVVQLVKPAHTRYLLVPTVVTMRIGRGWPAPRKRTPYNIQVGVNTRLSPRLQIGWGWSQDLDQTPYYIRVGDNSRLGMKKTSPTP
jgi:phage tail-like protein